MKRGKWIWVAILFVLLIVVVVSYFAAWVKTQYGRDQAVERLMTAIASNRQSIHLAPSEGGGRPNAEDPSSATRVAPHGDAIATFAGLLERYDALKEDRRGDLVAACDTLGPW